MNRLALAALALVLGAASSRAAGDAALTQARGTADNALYFDGGKARPSGDAVLAGPTKDTRTPEPIAADEQAKANLRPSTLTAPAIGPDKAKEPAKPNPWLDKGLIYSGIKGALVGALIGSFGGIFGALIGAAVGFAIAYAISKFT